MITNFNWALNTTKKSHRISLVHSYILLFYNFSLIKSFTHLPPYYLTHQEKWNNYRTSTTSHHPHTVAVRISVRGYDLLLLLDANSLCSQLMPNFQLPIRSHCLVSAQDTAPALCPSSVFPPQLIISMQPYCYFYLLLILQLPLHFTPPFYNKTQRKRCLFLLPPIFSPSKCAGLI